MESPPRTKTKTANKVQKHTDCSCSIRCGHNKGALASKVDFFNVFQGYTVCLDEENGRAQRWYTHIYSRKSSQKPLPMAIYTVVVYFETLARRRKVGRANIEWATTYDKGISLLPLDILHSRSGSGNVHYLIWLCFCYLLLRFAHMYTRLAWQQIPCSLTIRTDVLKGPKEITSAMCKG